MVKPAVYTSIDNHIHIFWDTEYWLSILKCFKWGVVTLMSQKNATKSFVLAVCHWILNFIGNAKFNQNKDHTIHLVYVTLNTQGAINKPCWLMFFSFIKILNNQRYNIQFEWFTQPNRLKKCPFAIKIKSIKMILHSSTLSMISPC